jgi:cytidyltransferase-like protein
MGKANTHLTHLEELVLTKGPAGYKMARAFLLELLKTLKGNTDSSIQTSVKWDGAPAIFAGINPENGRFFVGTKSIFNKVPKINYTEEDVLRNHGHAPGLVDKLVKALRYLPPLGIRNILQGDFMFDDEMIETVSIDGEPHYTFKPNTILYAVPVDSDLGQQIGRSKFGIVFHTTYDSLDSGATFGADVSTLRRVPGVWFDDAFFTDDTGVVTLTEEEEAQVVRLVREADTVNENIDYSDLPLDLLNIYINSEIKSGSFLENAEDSFGGFINWFSQRLQKRINSLKSEKGRQRATNNGTMLLNSFNSKKEDFINLFKVSRLLFEAKNIFIEKYNNAVYNTKHFVDDGSGDLVVTNPEGYVAVDHQGNGVKFVDRLEFSRANFAVDKGDKFGGQVSETGIIGEDPQEIELEFEDENPLADSSVSKTVAVVPGAFKPPHKGHLDMVQKYAGIADEVIVIISKPVARARKLPNGREVTAKDSFKIWEKLLDKIPNVDVRISDHASPINAAYEHVGDEGPIDIGDTVILGASTKDDDWRRWTGAEKYIKKGVTLLPPEETAVNPTVRPSGEPYSATAFRDALGDPENNKDEIAEFVGEENVDKVLEILGLSSNMKEQTSMGGGGVAIGTAPLGSGSDKPAKKDKKKRRTDEKLKLANEVMKLIIERGILR